MYQLLSLFLCKFVELFADLSCILIFGILVFVPLLVKMITKSWRAWAYAVCALIVMFCALRYYVGA